MLESFEPKGRKITARVGKRETEREEAGDYQTLFEWLRKQITVTRSGRR